MSDSSSFREIAQEATETAEVPVTQPEVATETKTEAPAVEAPQEETFADPVDPKSLEGMTPQQLLEVRKNWERAYTQKRQKETAELKEYQRKIAELESRPQTPQVDVQEKAQEAQRQVELGEMSVSEYTEYVKGLMADEARRVAREEYKAIHQEEVEAQLQTKAAEDFTSSDDRFDEHHPSYNESFKVDVQRELAELLDKHIEENGSYAGFDTKALTKAIVQRKDAELDNIIKTRTQQSTEAAKLKEAKMRKTEVRGSSSDSQRIGGNSIRDVLTDTLNGS